MIRFGVDLGGTKIELVALDDSGKELYRKRVPTPKVYQGTITTISDLVTEAEAELGQKGSVGVGIPGVVSPFTGLVKNANSTWINGHALDKDLGELLQREVRVSNDANCFAVSEATDGAAKGKAVVFGVIIGTGCGGGIVFNGKVHGGGNGIGGEWGHNPLPWLSKDEYQSTQCFCGNKDCIETYVSGTGFIRDYQANGGNVSTGLEIMERFHQGDTLATQTFERYIDRLARALAHMINMLDPDAIVLGGGMSNIDEIYRRLPLVLKQYVLGKECKTPILKNKFGCSSGVRGAAWLWGKG
ncbi:fructokinase [Parashewanella tropica]|uniref:fructokinase n=1 Tax=Parashewanella tropica TaxID=2547970 RepID=UPI001059F4C6|nr:fructokinase [Parashewanella tropica]